MFAVPPYRRKHVHQESTSCRRLGGKELPQPLFAESFYDLIHISFNLGSLFSQLALGLVQLRNVLAHVLNKRYEYILAEFEGRPLAASMQGYGDVKYHLGYSTDYETIEGKKVHVWTVNESDEMRSVLDLGVDGIVTDYPERMAILLESTS